MMKVGDLVVYDRKKRIASVPPVDFERLGIVVTVVAHHLPPLHDGSPWASLPMVLVQWNGVAGTLQHRQDLLEVVSENR